MVQYGLEDAFSLFIFQEPPHALMQFYSYVPDWIVADGITFDLADFYSLH